MFTAAYMKHTLVFKKPAGTSRGVLRTKETYFVRLARRDEPAAFGLGECGPLPGLSPDDRPDFEARLARLCRQINQGQPPEALDLAGFPALAFGLETARLDLQGGGRRLLFDTAFSRGQAVLPIHGLIWMDSRQEMLQQARQKVARGFTCLKLKVGALDFQEECALLADIRRAFPAPEVELRLDANGAFQPGAALAHLEALARFDVHFLEQPLKPGQTSALAELCAASPIPIALDEELIGLTARADKEALLAAVRPQHLVLKPTLLGGLAAAREWIDLAEAMGIGWWINSALESNVGLNALCQWTSSLNPAAPQGLGTGRLYANNFPSPIELAPGGLAYNPRAGWDLAGLS